MNSKSRKKIAGLVKGLAEASAKNGVSKKLIIMFYEPEIPEAVRKFAAKNR